MAGYHLIGTTARSGPRCRGGWKHETGHLPTRARGNDAGGKGCDRLSPPAHTRAGERDIAVRYQIPVATGPHARGGTVLSDADLDARVHRPTRARGNGQTTLKMQPGPAPAHTRAGERLSLGSALVFRTTSPRTRRTGTPCARWRCRHQSGRAAGWPLVLRGAADHGRGAGVVFVDNCGARIQIFGVPLHIMRCCDVRVAAQLGRPSDGAGTPPVRRA